MKKKKIPEVYTCTASHCLITAAIIIIVIELSRAHLATAHAHIG